MIHTVTSPAQSFDVFLIEGNAHVPFSFGCNAVLEGRVTWVPNVNPAMEPGLKREIQSIERKLPLISCIVVTYSGTIVSIIF